MKLVQLKLYNKQHATGKVVTVHLIVPAQQLMSNITHCCPVVNNCSLCWFRGSGRGPQWSLRAHSCTLRTSNCSTNLSYSIFISLPVAAHSQVALVSFLMTKHLHLTTVLSLNCSLLPKTNWLSWMLYCLYFGQLLNNRIVFQLTHSWRTHDNPTQDYLTDPFNSG